MVGRKVERVVADRSAKTVLGYPRRHAWIPLQKSVHAITFANTKVVRSRSYAMEISGA